MINATNTKSFSNPFNRTNARETGYGIFNQKLTIMKTYETQIDKTVTAIHASSLPAGYGHKKITVELMSEDGRTKEFAATTNNMPGFDAANDLEGQEKYGALYELIENQIADRVYEWLVEEK